MAYAALQSFVSANDKSGLALLRTGIKCRLIPRILTIHSIPGKPSRSLRQLDAAFRKESSHRNQFIVRSSTNEKGPHQNGNSIKAGSHSLVQLEEEGIGGRLTRQQAFALASALLLNMFLGSLYCWSCYLAPLEATLGMPFALSSAVFSLATVVFTLGTTWAAPMVVASVPPPQVVGLVGVLGTGGLAVAALAPTLNSPIPLFIGYSLLFGIASGIGYGLTTQVANSSFKSAKGLATGCIVSARALGPAVLAPLLSSAIAKWGLGITLLAQGLALGLGCVLVSAWMRFGADFKVPLASKPTPQGDLSPEQLRASLVLRPMVYWLWAVIGLGCFSGLMTTAHAAALMTSVSQSTSTSLFASAGAGVSLVTLGSALGRVGGGWLADLTSPKLLLTTSALLSALPLLWAAQTNTLLSVQVALAVAGLAYGSMAIAIPVHVGRVVDAGDFARIYGRVFLCWGLCGLIAPLVAGRFFDIYGSYSQALFFAGIAALLASLAAYLMPSDQQLVHRMNSENKTI